MKYTVDWALLTRRFIFAIAVLVGLYDLAAAAFGGAKSTITVQIWQMVGANWKGSTLAFVFGYIGGHIFGRVD